MLFAIPRLPMGHHLDGLLLPIYCKARLGIATATFLLPLGVPAWQAANPVQFAPVQQVASSILIQTKDGNQEFDERFDRLQQQQQIRQELNQPEFQPRLDPQESPAFPAADRLQTEQRMQHQLNLYELQHGQGGAVDSSGTMDRLQLEQQMQQQLNQR